MSNEQPPPTGPSIASPGAVPASSSPGQARRAATSLANTNEPDLSALRQPIPNHRVEDLMSGQREAILSFGGEPYRLRITSNNKLILTK